MHDAEEQNFGCWLDVEMKDLDAEVKNLDVEVKELNVELEGP